MLSTQPVVVYLSLLGFKGALPRGTQNWLAAKNPQIQALGQSCEFGSS